MHVIIHFVLFINFSKDNLVYVMYMPTKLVLCCLILILFLKKIVKQMDLEFQ
jgi:hypothetical protein